MSMPLRHRTVGSVYDVRAARISAVNVKCIPALQIVVHSKNRLSPSVPLLLPEYSRVVRACATTSCVEAIDHVDHGTLDDTFYRSFVQPSQELKELCSRQLEAVYEFLARCGNVTSNIRATAYVRCADIITDNSLQLRKVVSHSPGHLSTIPHQYEDENVLQLAGPDGQTSVEEYLLQQSVLELPNSPTAVLPLCETGVLVGLLVLERSLPSSDFRPWTQTAGDGNASLFTEDELWFFRKVVPSLAAACAMELRTSMTRADASARQQAMVALLQGTRGPLTALRTFGSMLLPRLHEGEPDRDLASNMVVQSKHLEEVVQQLEAALRPDPTTQFPPLFDAPPTTDHLSFNTPDYPPQVPFPPFAPSSTLRDNRDTRIPPSLLNPSAHFSTQSNLPLASHHQHTSISETQASLTHRLTAATPNHPPANISHTVSATTTTAPTTTVTLPTQSTPAPSLSIPPSPLSAISRPTPIPSSTAAPPSTLQSLTIHRGISDLPYSNPSDQITFDECVAVIPPPPAPLSMDIDVDQLNLVPTLLPTDPADTDRHASNAAASTSLPQAAPTAECHLADALVNVLTATHNMCTARGQQMVVAHPLRTAAQKVAQQPCSGAEAAAPPRLLPRPVRPLWAAVPTQVVSQAVSYVLEVVLASCTAGGLVGVTAQRTDSSPSGIQLIVLFTGTLRIVPPSAISDWQVALGGSGGRPEGAAGASSLELAQNLLQRAGGRISITYPCNLKSRRSQAVEVGTCVEVWLPAAKQPAEKADVWSGGQGR